MVDLLGHFGMVLTAWGCASREIQKKAVFAVARDYLRRRLRVKPDGGVRWVRLLPYWFNCTIALPLVYSILTMSPTCGALARVPFGCRITTVAEMACNIVSWPSQTTLPT